MNAAVGVSLCPPDDDVDDDDFTSQRSVTTTERELERQLYRRRSINTSDIVVCLRCCV